MNIHGIISIMLFGTIVKERLFKNWSIYVHMFCQLKYSKNVGVIY